MSGRTNLSSGDYKGFLFSIYGVPVVILGIILLLIILGLTINTFIIVSSLVEEHKFNVKMKSVLMASFKSIKHFFSPLGILIVIYTAFVTPLIGLGIKMGPLKNFKIPNFITSVIWNNTLYSILYATALTGLFILTFFYIFSLHFILLDGEKPLDAFKKSRKLMKKYWKSFIKEYLTKFIKFLFVSMIIILIFALIIGIVYIVFSKFIINNNVAIILLVFSILEITGIIGLLTIPISISYVTQLFYKFNKDDGRTIECNLVATAFTLSSGTLTNKIKKKTKAEIVVLAILMIAFNLGIATLMDANFDEIFKTNVDIQIVGHRAAGDLEAENSVEGIEIAAKEGAKWAEIDVQRTKDGKYIINHDSNFKRTSGVNKKPMEMTLEEIKKLEVKNEFDPSKPSRKVATFEEILDAAKGKIGVFVELKGASADEQMVDDVIKIIKDKNMLDECVILSLDYKIIEYTHNHFPEIKTGFLYFFSTGNLEDLKGDYLIMEEREATENKINEIHAAGKKAIVWTVNTPESVKKFVRSNVDGIITDYILLVKDGIEEANNRTKLEIMLDFLEF